MDDLDACLFEMDAAVGIPVNVAEKGHNADADLVDESKPNEDSEVLCDSSSSQADTQSSAGLWDPSAKPPPLPRTTLSAASNADTTPFPQVEALRLKAVAGLLAWMHKECTRGGVDFRTPTFERWLITTRQCQPEREKHTPGSSSSKMAVDPILPSAPKTDEAFLLGQELVENGASPEFALTLTEELHRQTANAAADVIKASQAAVERANKKKAINGGSAFLEVRISSAPAAAAFLSADGFAKKKQRKQELETEEDEEVEHEKGSKKKKKTKAEKTGEDEEEPLLMLEGKGGAKSFVNKDHYNKLCALYARYAPTTTTGGRVYTKLEQKQRRDAAILAMLQRYHALSGGATNGSGGGMQGALNGSLFHVLREELGVSLECFASPLNCYFGRYCSAFRDLDPCFGSLGSFFDFHPTEGSFEANPPFVPVVMEAMHAHIESLLVASCGGSHRSGVSSGGAGKAADELPVVYPDGTFPDGSSKPLCFVVVIPLWTPLNHFDFGRGGNHDGGGQEGEFATTRRAVRAASGVSWQALRGSTFLRKHVKLAAQAHGYVEGSQHVRATRYKTSRFDSSIFVLQNDAAARKWPCTKAVCARLREAFKSKFNEELEARKGGKNSGMEKMSAQALQNELQSSAAIMAGEVPVATDTPTVAKGGSSEVTEKAQSDEKFKKCVVSAPGALSKPENSLELKKNKRKSKKETSPPAKKIKN